MGCGNSKSSQGVTAPQPSKPGPVFEQPSKPGPVLELPSKAAPAKPAPAETSPTKQVAAPSKPAPTPHAKVDPVKPAAATAASTSLDVMASAAQHGAQSPRFIRVEAESTEYGTKLFAGEIADKFLAKYGESAALLKNLAWTKDVAKADKVAAAILDWGLAEGATNFSHVFQPLGAIGVRHGCTGQLHNQLFTFGADGKPEYKFKAEQLLRGETDGSSYPNGGLRITHTAGAYTILDPTSPIWMRDDTIFAPTVFLAYTGHALDYKLPLLRSDQAMSRECCRLLGLMGYKVSGCQSNIGLEQEFFLIPSDAYARRPDLQQAGRTLLGKFPARGQEMSDHYMAPLNPNALNCLREIQHECFKMGIPLKTRHREVAPNQYEMAPYFGHVTSQIDQNIMAMQVCEEVASKHNLVCLLHEKPFQGINGSGKHNNWSIGTQDGVNLLNAGQITAKSGNPEIFPVIMAAIVAGVDKHGDLMRAAIAAPGNDFRLGAMEAPPAIISTYLGESCTEFLDNFRNGKPAEYKPQPRSVDTGNSDIFSAFEVPTEDRNRTSPFPYGGHRFEFRAVGSSQNVSFVNTVLNTMCAEMFAEFADKIEKGAKPADVAAEALNTHWKVIFNGNGYGADWPVEAVKRGVWKIDEGWKAIERMGDQKNIDLFEKMKVLTKDELIARRDVDWGHYIGLVEIEAGTMIDMVTQSIVPVLKKEGISEKDVVATCKAVADKLAHLHKTDDLCKRAELARDLRLVVMAECRKACDEAEGKCPAALWPFATYRELLFLDQNQDYFGQTTLNKPIAAYLLR